MIKPSARLSWQYHFRRLEIWKVHKGSVGIIRGFDNIQGKLQIANTGQIIKLAKEERHRLIGLENWGIVAEFWQHTDALIPSDENDIIRLEY